MSAITIVEMKNAESKPVKISFITQRYVVGLYIAIYQGKALLSQGGKNTTEYKFHKSLRNKTKKNNDKVLEEESTDLELIKANDEKFKEEHK